MRDDGQESNEDDADDEDFVSPAHQEESKSNEEEDVEMNDQET